MRDLPDLGLLASTRPVVAGELRRALETTFTFHATHAVPTEVPAPPTSWEVPYLNLAEENALPWPTLAESHAAVVAFLGPVLAGESGIWNPSDGRWYTPA